MNASDSPSPADASRCPRCLAIPPADAPAGLCPACLVSVHFGTEADLSEPVSDATVPTPSVEDVAPHFPQLEILSCLGRGGMGVVYKAMQKSLGRLVALKLLAPERGSDRAFAERFAREAQALARLDHPHIVTIHDFGQAGGYFYLLMEFVDGVTLRQLGDGGRIAPREALAIVPQICDALQFAHDHGIVHRDIKPENILLDRRGHAKVADFGLAKLVGHGGEEAGGERRGAGMLEPDLTEAGKVMGTPRYMAPEQREHPTAVDHRADIYALGVVLYQLLTGELPDENKLQPPSRRVHLDVRLDEVVLRALEKEPARRYASATEFKTVLEAVGAPTLTPPPGAVAGAAASSPGGGLGRGGVVERLRPAAIALIVVSVLDLVGLGFGLLVSLVVILALPVLGVASAVGPSTVAALAFLRSPLPIIGLASFAAAVVVIGWILLHVAANVYVINGARRMLKGRDTARTRRVAIVAIVLGVLDLMTSGASVVGWFNLIWSVMQVGAGIWILVLWNQPEVRAALSAADQEPQPETKAPHASAPRNSGPATPPGVRVAVPATGLLVAAGLQLLIVVAVLAVFITQTSYRSEGATGVLEIGPPSVHYRTTTTPSFGPPTAYALAPIVLFAALLVSVLVGIGAWRMRRLRGHSMSLTAAVLAILTMQGLGLGVIFGLWSLIVLLRREVHAAFDKGVPARRLTGLFTASAVVAGLSVLFAAVVMAMLATRQRAWHALAENQRATPLAPLPAPASTLPALPEGGLDLSAHWTRVFPKDTSSSFGLTTLRGLQVFDGQPPFLVGGQVVLVGQRLESNLEPPAPPKPLPVAIELPVGRTFAELHLLHATFWSDPVGVEVATLRFRYTDGEARSFPLRYGVHVLDWQRLPSETVESLSDPGSALVWRGTGAPGQRSTARAIATTVPNPRPDVPVASLEWISTRSVASYALLAATISKLPAQDQAQIGPVR